jgi:outer membrane protein
MAITHRRDVRRRDADGARVDQTGNEVMSKSAGLMLAAAAAATLLAAPATAADISAHPVYKAAPMVDVWNPWQIRVRALGVVTRDSGSVNLGGAPVAGSNLTTSDAAVPELDITYYFTRNIAAEIILGVTKHDITGSGSIASVPVGSAWLLPPTLTLQYHFTDFGAFKPYIGAGVNYTIFFSEKAGNTATATPSGVLTVTNSDLKNAFAPVVQIGFDYMIDKHWGLNVDVKKLWLRPDWSGTINATAATGKVNLDPWLIGGGVTYKF